jgi:hypothetical protein
MSRPTQEKETDVRILVAIDGSNDAKAAVAWLGHLPLPAGQNVKVLTAVLPPIAFIDVDKAQEVRATLMAEARRLVTDTASELRLSGEFTRGEVVVEDDARQAIVTAAGEWHAGPDRNGSARAWQRRPVLSRQRLPRGCAGCAVPRARLQDSATRIANRHGRA